MNKPRTLVLRGILTDRESRVLLLQRSSQSKGWPGYWEFPGGKVDCSEGLVQALQREFVEETGLQVDVGKLCAAFEWEREDDFLMYLIYQVRVTASREVAISPEHDAFGWYTAADLLSVKVSPPLKDLVQKLGLKEQRCV
ncbi:MAG: NUDIX hydrolase [Candidatus Omnitrophica bacterium]|nr:NUDIX hydrolase [Candidatus Omnitrophota bacterium]